MPSSSRMAVGSGLGADRSAELAGWQRGPCPGSTRPPSDWWPHAGSLGWGPGRGHTYFAWRCGTAVLLGKSYESQRLREKGAREEEAAGRVSPPQRLQRTFSPAQCYSQELMLHL